MTAENKKFKRLVKRYFGSYIKRFPEQGSFLGLHKYDGKWSEEDKKAYLNNIEFFKKYLREFKKINQGKLLQKDGLDREIIIHDLGLTIFYLEDLRLWESDPDILEWIGSALFLLLNRNTFPFSEKIKKINLALRNVPILLAQVKTRITNPYKLWTEIAIESCDGLKLFLNSLKQVKIDKKTKKELLKNIETSTKTVED